MSTLKALDSSFSNGTADQYSLLSAALFMPLGAALANALQLLVAEAPTALLSEVCAACSPACVTHVGECQCELVHHTAAALASYSLVFGRTSGLRDIQCFA
jgi:hypothetical protein